MHRRKGAEFPGRKRECAALVSSPPSLRGWVGEEGIVFAGAGRRKGREHEVGERGRGKWETGTGGRPPRLAMKTDGNTEKFHFYFCFYIFFYGNGIEFGKYGYGNEIKLRESTEMNQYGC